MKLLDIAKKLNKAYGTDKLIIQADLVPEYQRLSFRSLGFTYPTFGGLPLGRIVTFAGVNHSGKTLASFVAISEYQRQFPDKVCVFVDVEHTADLNFLSHQSEVDLSKLYYVNTDTLGGEDILDLVVNLQQSEDIGLIVIDSMPALVSTKNMEADIEQNTGMAGHMAIPIQRFLNKMSPLVAKQNNLLILINQVREKTTPNGAIIYHEPGGSAMGFVPSMKVRFGRRTYIKGDNDNSNDGEDADGFKLSFVITKSKTSSIQRGGGFISFSYKNGLDIVRDTIEIASKFGFMDKVGSYYTLINPATAEVLVDKEGNPLKFHGKQKIRDYLSEHKEFAKSYIEILTQAIVGADKPTKRLLDEATLQAILEEEASVEAQNKK